ncbi:MAG: hypothetical protein MUC91_05515 [Verrucomicrobia bacterium]|nr:hypothetical protein [Verrucomicrobiota bacterium]
MKTLTLVALLTAVALLGLPAHTGFAAGTDSPAQNWEYALVKWDGPDRIYYNRPGAFEMVHLNDLGVKIPKGAQPEEFCLAWAANKMAAEGWEAVNLDSRRILMRRPKTP